MQAAKGDAEALMQQLNTREQERKHHASILYGNLHHLLRQVSQLTEEVSDMQDDNASARKQHEESIATAARKGAAHEQEVLAEIDSVSSAPVGSMEPRKRLASSLSCF